MPPTVSQHKHLETKGAYARNLGLLNIKSRTEVSCTTQCEFVNSCLFGFLYCAASRERSAAGVSVGQAIILRACSCDLSRRQGRVAITKRRYGPVRTDNRDCSIPAIFDIRGRLHSHQVGDGGSHRPATGAFLFNSHLPNQRSSFYSLLHVKVSQSSSLA